MKVFLSHPMNGLTEDEVMVIRSRALANLKRHYGEDVELIDNYHHENVPEGAGRIWHLGASIQLMEQADAVYISKPRIFRRKTDPKGCFVEQVVCEKYGLRLLNNELKWHYFEDEWSDD